MKHGYPSFKKEFGLKDETILRPCPFCGSKEVITVADLIYEGDVGIECQNCGIQFFAPTNYALIEDEKGYMVSVWNKRVDDD